MKESCLERNKEQILSVGSSPHFGRALLSKEANNTSQQSFPFVRNGGNYGSTSIRRKLAQLSIGFEYYFLYLQSKSIFNLFNSVFGKHIHSTSIMKKSLSVILKSFLYKICVILMNGLD